MWSLLFRCYDDNLIAALAEAGTAGLLEDPGGLRAFFDDRIDARQFADLGGEFRVEPVTAAPDESADWEPLAIGKRFYIVPPGFAGRVPDGRLKLELHTGAAFGTGRHETTQLCLEALERYLQAGQLVADIGCGSGILSAAATVLGARRVFSCDIDDDSVRLTNRHAGVDVFCGSADAIAARSADLVLANLTAPILDNLAWHLARIAKPGGLLLITGFLKGNPPRRFTPAASCERSDWQCWVCHPGGITAPSPAAGGLTHEAEWWL